MDRETLYAEAHKLAEARVHDRMDTSKNLVISAMI